MRDAMRRDMLDVVYAGLKESKTFRLSQSDKDVMKQINKIRDKCLSSVQGQKNIRH